MQSVIVTAPWMLHSSYSRLECPAYRLCCQARILLQTTLHASMLPAGDHGGLPARVQSLPTGSAA